ncbi:MAG: response regulator [Eubacteriales bacterium]
MYRVIIVDDEENIRKLLKATIKWNQLGFDIVGEASSGIKAINIIDEIQPDVAFVDIRMPFMDGIEFSKIAIKRYPNLKIVILTAYDDFEYAKECIGIGVFEYLLKPINKKEINEILLKIKEKLDKEKPMNLEKNNLEIDKSTAINKVKEFLINNYTNPELNLTSVAIEFSFNPSYLSRIFKEETGSSFIDYLTGCRMERAISLAEEGKYMYQVANEVGIPDPNYFGKCFKKYTGKTFSQYVKSS